MFQRDGPWDFRKAIVESLANHGGMIGLPKILDGWQTYGPRTRSFLVETLLSNWTTAQQLLIFVEKNPSVKSALSTLQIISLKRHANQMVRKLTNRIFEEREESDRSALVERYASGLSPIGDPLAGRNHFEQLCASCHRVGDTGFHVGPDLASLTDKSVRSMLVAILDPNRAVEDKYGQYTVETSNGDIFAGVVEQESDTSVTLVGIGGIRHEALKSNIRSMESSGVSLMPEGLEAGLDSQGMADLIAYLRDSDDSLKIAQDADGSIRLEAKRGLASGESVYFNSERETLDEIGAGDLIEWTVHGVRSGLYSIFSDAALLVEYEGRPFKLYMNDRFVTGVVSPTGDSDRFRHRKFGDIEIEEDLEVARFRLEHRLDGAPLFLKELRLIPSD